MNFAPSAFDEKYVYSLKPSSLFQSGCAKTGAVVMFSLRVSIACTNFLFALTLLPLFSASVQVSMIGAAISLKFSMNRL